MTFQSKSSGRLVHRRSLYAAALAAAAVILAGCDDQNVLYKSKSKDPVPPVQSVASSAMAAVSSPAQAQMAPATESTLPEPRIVDFSRAEAPVEVVERDIQGVRFAIPKDYESQAPTSSMRAAQFAVPNSDGEAGELVVFYFGRKQGGGALENASRWAGQFTPPEGHDSPVQLFEQDADVNGMAVTRLKLHGAWNGGMSQGGAQAEWAMDALIVEGGPNGSLFLRLTGPAKLVDKQEMALDYTAANLHFADFDTKPVEGADKITPEPPAAPSLDDMATSPSSLSLVQAPGLHFAVPANWKSTPPSNKMRSLQFELPAHGAAEAPEMVVYYFGPNGGGSTQDNLLRWASQMKQPDGSSPMDKATVEHTDVRGLQVSSIYVEGSYNAGSMSMTGGTAAETKDDYAMMGLIVEGGSKGPLYLKLTGPAEAVRASRSDLQILLSTLAPMSDEEADAMDKMHQ